MSYTETGKFYFKDREELRQSIYDLGGRIVGEETKDAFTVALPRSDGNGKMVFDMTELSDLPLRVSNSPGEAGDIEI